MREAPDWAHHQIERAIASLDADHEAAVAHSLGGTVVWDAQLWGVQDIVHMTTAPFWDKHKHVCDWRTWVQLKARFLRAKRVF